MIKGPGLPPISRQWPHPPWHILVIFVLVTGSAARGGLCLAVSRWWCGSQHTQLSPPGSGDAGIHEPQPCSNCEHTNSKGAWDWRVLKIIMLLTKPDTVVRLDPSVSTSVCVPQRVTRGTESRSCSRQTQSSAICTRVHSPSLWLDGGPALCPLISQIIWQTLYTDTGSSSADCMWVVALSMKQRHCDCNLLVRTGVVYGTGCDSSFVIN